MKRNRPVFRFLLILALAATGYVSDAAYARSPMTMRLVWSPTTDIDDAGEVDLSGLGSLRLEFLELADERIDKDRVGENRENDPKVFPVSTPDNVPLFVTRGIREVFNRVGLRIVDSDGDVVISGALRRFLATEISTYDAEVAVWVTATGRGGKLLWEGVVSGTATRWGREFKAANYCEVLSDSVFDAATQLLQNASFREALRESHGATPQNAPGAS